MNISIPDELADRVRDLDFSISGVCQKALSAAVEDAERRAAFTGDLDQVVARLRATLDAEDVEQREEGLADGTAWAKGWATAGELAALPSDGTDGLDPTSETLVSFTSTKHGQRIVSVNINLDEDLDYWNAFLDGALAVWEAVAERVLGGAAC